MLKVKDSLLYRQHIIVGVSCFSSFNHLNIFKIDTVGAAISYFDF
jgi:hypothetical protein